ncbi:hypothetical protein CDIK_2850 [Cucumispora dikerogammari]|nr:hypothetical protein CDIK_2850 [Cucumispora dikerogammari]
MFNLILCYCNYICSNKESDRERKINRKLLREYHNYKCGVLKIERKRVEIQKMFDIRFQKRINKYFLPRHSNANLISYTDDKKINSVANELSLKYLPLKRILKKLFFTDLISFFCDTLLVINFAVKKSNLADSFYDSRDLCLGTISLGSQFSIENNIKFDFLERINKTDHSWMYYWTRLEKMVFEYAGNNPDILRECLYSEFDFYLVVKNNILVSYFYMFLANFIELSFMNINNSEAKTYEKVLKRLEYDLPVTVIPFLEKSYFKFFLRNKHHFKINAVYDSKYLRNFPDDHCYRQFKRDFKALKTCCYKKGSNLLTLNCKMQMHNNTISEIKKRVFYNLRPDFFNRDSCFYDILIDFIKERHVTYRFLNRKI